MSVKKIINNVLKIDYFLAIVSLVLLLGTTFFGVFMRYVFNSPFVWLEEVQMMTILWVVFFGGSAAVRVGSHVAIEFVTDKFPKSVQKYFTVLQLVAISVVLWFLSKNSIALIGQYIKTGRETNLLHIPYVLIYSAVPIGCFLIVLNYFVVSIEEIFNIEILESEDNDGH